MQVPQSNNSDYTITRVQCSPRITGLHIFVPYPVGQVVRQLGCIDDNAKYTVEHVQQQRQLKRMVDAQKHFHCSQMYVSQVSNVRHAESRYSQPCRAAGRGIDPTFPPRVLRFVDQIRYVFVEVLQSKVQCQTHDVEELFDHNAIDVRQERKQANEVLLLEPMYKK